MARSLASSLIVLRQMAEVDAEALAGLLLPVHGEAEVREAFRAAWGPTCDHAIACALEAAPDRDRLAEAAEVLRERGFLDLLDPGDAAGG